MRSTRFIVWQPTTTSQSFRDSLNSTRVSRSVWMHKTWPKYLNLFYFLFVLKIELNNSKLHLTSELLPTFFLHCIRPLLWRRRCSNTESHRFRFRWGIGESGWKTEALENLWATLLNVSFAFLSFVCHSLSSPSAWLNLATKWTCRSMRCEKFAHLPFDYWYLCSGTGGINWENC